MARPSRVRERRERLLPVVAETFGRLGYARTTTAVLARRCRVRENILYRLWPDKRAMFLAAIGHVYDLSERLWERLPGAGTGRSHAERLLAYEAEHLGELGLQRILFAGFGETDDAGIREALRRTYARFQAWIRRRVEEHRGGRRARPDPELSAWGLVGLGTMVTLGRELGLFSGRDRRRLVGEVGRLLLEGRPR